MKQIIRLNTFETNSSSMHSLVVTKHAKPYTQYEKTLHYYGHEFELFGCCDTTHFERHPFEVLSDPKDKLRYYVAHYVGFKDQKERLKEVEDLVYEITKCSRDKIKLYHEEVKNWRSGEIEKSYGWAGINDTGEDVFDYIERNNISLREFIFDPRYTIIVDGDEYQEFKKLFTKGLIDINNIEYISSGKSFWIDDVKTFSLYFINRFIEDSVYNEMMEELNDYNNEFIKCIQIEDENENIIQPALITFAGVLECFKNLSYGRSIPIKLILKKHNKEDYEPILKYIDSIEKL